MAQGNFRRGWPVLLLAALWYAGVAVAHHSAGMFDPEHRMTLAGTVREFQWTNPHCYLQLVVKNSRGQDEEWSLEMAAPMYLYPLGFRPSTLKPGDKVTAVAMPLRKGGKGGLLIEVVTAAGKRLGMSKQP